MSRSRYRAFTLFELMVAIVMSATIAGSLAASLYVGFRARNSAEAAVESTHITDAIGDVMVRDLALTIPPSTAQYFATFMGAADGIGFYASGAEAKSAIQGGCKYIEYALDQDPADGSTVLVRRVTTNLLAPTTPDPVTERICANVESLAFAYYDGTQWVDEWDSTQQNNTAPVAVQITVVLKPRVEGGPSIQDTRVVRLAVGTAAATQ